MKYQVNNKINKILLFLSSLLLIGVFFPLFKIKGTSSSFVNGQFNESSVESSSVMVISTWVGVLTLVMIVFILYSLFKNKVDKIYFYLTILFYTLIPIILYLYLIHLKSTGYNTSSIGNNGTYSVHRTVRINEITLIYYLFLSFIGVILSLFRRKKLNTK